MVRITQNEFDHPKFSVNASNLVLMPKKTDGEGHYNFIFLKSCFTQV
jgi:hypothetical protein